MSLLIVMKETIKLPTGIVWSCSAISTLLFWNVIEVDCSLIPNTDSIDVTIARFSQVLPYITIMTVSFIAIS
ncbi:MAG: hypothetical protein ACTSRU_10300 [Candidatus Hodarchaeales archaeon]